MARRMGAVHHRRRLLASGLVAEAGSAL